MDKIYTLKDVDTWLANDAVMWGKEAQLKVAPAIAAAYVDMDKTLRAIANDITDLKYIGPIGAEPQAEDMSQTIQRMRERTEAYVDERLWNTIDLIHRFTLTTEGEQAQAVELLRENAKMAGIMAKQMHGFIDGELSYSQAVKLASRFD